MVAVAKTDANMLAALSVPPRIVGQDIQDVFATLTSKAPISVQQYGAVGDGATNDAPAFQAVHDDLVARGIKASAVYVPPTANGYLINSAVTLSGAALTFVGGGYLADPSVAGTWLKITNTGFTPFTITGLASRGTTFRDMAIFQTHPVVGGGWTPTVYPDVFDVQSTFGEFSLENIFAVNIYKLCNAFEAGRVNLRNIKGQIFKTCLTLDKELDVARVFDVHLWPYWSNATVVMEWTQANGDCFVFSRCDTPFVDNIFCFSYRSLFRFTTSADGQTSQFTGGKLVADFTQYGLWIESNDFTGRIASLYVQGEDVTTLGAGTPITGGRAILLAGDDARFQIGALATERHAKNAIEITGDGGTVHVGKAIHRYFNQDNDGSGALKISGASALVYGVEPTRLDSNSGPLSDSGTTTVTGTLQNIVTGSVNEVRTYSSATGNAVKVAPLGSDTNVEIQLDAKGNTRSTLSANSKRIVGADDNAGTGDSGILFRSGVGSVDVFLESSGSNCNLNIAPKGSGVVIPGAPVRTKSYAVASLPTGAAGDAAFASNGRKNGEGGGAGTGVLVFHDGTAWRACDTGATVAS